MRTEARRRRAAAAPSGAEVDRGIVEAEWGVDGAGAGIELVSASAYATCATAGEPANGEPPFTRARSTRRSADFGEETAGAARFLLGAHGVHVVELRHRERTAGIPRAD